MSPGTLRALSRPLAASAALHAVASPFAGALGMAACPLLDATGLTGVSLAMLVTSAVAWAGYWIAQLRFARRWSSAATGAALAEADVAALFQGTFRGVLLHVGAYLAATLAGAVTLHALYGHAVTNWRFWAASMLVAGFVIVLHAVLLEWMLARDLARAGNARWRYRAPASALTLADVVLFAVATLPVGVMAALVYRRVVLDREMLTAQELVWLLLRIGALVAAWAVAVVGLLRWVQRRASEEALALIRELDKPLIPRRANLTVGGDWGETASALNVAADSLEQRARLEHAVRTYVGDELADRTRTSDVTETRPERCRMTVLFADIRGFTSRSATIPPEDVVAMLDSYFERAVAVIEGHGGHVDKFLGDGLMAWFESDRDGSVSASCGARVAALRGTAPGPDLGAARAVAAADALLVAVEDFNADLSRRGVRPIRVGVGLHAGDVVRGNLGTGRRKQWTVIGDTVNLASRMESMTKTLDRDIAFTAPVAAQLAADRVEPLGDHEIRGQPKPVACFALRPA